MADKIKKGIIKEKGSLLSGLQIYKRTDDDTKNYYSFDNTTNYLQSELWIDFQAERDRNMMTAVNDPETFISNRTEKIKELVSKGSTIDTYFTERISELIEMGIPPEQARAMALKSAKKLLEEQVQILEFKWPGLYEKAFGVATDHNEDIYKKAGNSGITADETLSEYKLRKKGQKTLASMK